MQAAWRWCAIAAVMLAPDGEAADLRVLVSGVAEAEGKILCLLFERERGFPDNLERAAVVVDYPAAVPMLTCTFPDTKPGRYAVAVLHDRNGNGEFDNDFEGSGEAWGVTNNVRPVERAPKFVEAVIYMGSMADYEVEIRP